MIVAIADYPTERAILGAVIVNPRAFAAFHGHLTAADFHHADHAAIWEVIVSLQTDGLPIDQRMVAQRHGSVQLVRDLVAEEAQYLSASRQWKEWRTSIRATTARRQLQSLGESLLTNAADAPLNELLDHLQAVQREATEGRTVRQATHIRDLMAAVQADVIRELEGENISRGLCTGYQRLDDLTNGLRGFVAIGARTHMGKTTLLCNMAARMITEDHRPVIFSAEMGERSIGRKIWMAHSRWNPKRARLGYYGDYEAERIMRGAKELGSRDAWVLDRVRGADEIATEAHRRLDRDGAGCVMIDYLQLLTNGESRKLSDYEANTLVCRRVTGLKNDLGVPVIVAVQMNRDTMKGSTGRPYLHQFKSTGQIEQDIDIGILMHREHPKSQDLMLFVDKVREEGETGVVACNYDLPTQCITEKNIQPDDEPATHDGDLPPI